MVVRAGFRTILLFADITSLELFALHAEVLAALATEKCFVVTIGAEAPGALIATRSIAAGNAKNTVAGFTVCLVSALIACRLRTHPTLGDIMAFLAVGISAILAKLYT